MALARGMVASDVAESDSSSTSITSPLAVQTVGMRPTSALSQESPTTGHRQARPPDKQPSNSIRGFFNVLLHPVLAAKHYWALRAARAEAFLEARKKHRKEDLHHGSMVDEQRHAVGTSVNLLLFFAYKILGFPLSARTGRAQR